MVARLMSVNNLNRMGEVSLIPVPQSVTLAEHRYTAGTGAGLIWPGAIDKRVEAWAMSLADSNFGESLAIHVDRLQDGMPSLDDDASYALKRVDGQLTLQAATTWGALHGITTCYQLAQHNELERVDHIEDAPRFPWRGLLIDVARHFMPLELLRQVVDGMAILKMNVLHLHLSDDQAVRFQSRSFPELAHVQSYTQDDLRGLVEYASGRGIRVIPELDVPGHVHAWLVGYPAWGGLFDAPSVTSRFGVHKAALNPADDDVYSALECLFDEICEVFPDQFVHIGGDEVHPGAWQDNTDVEALMQRENLADFRAVQNHFNERVVDLLNARDRRAIGWDEVLHEDMPDMVVQNWQGATSRDQILQRPLDCIVSAPYYLDLFYPADVHYAFDPEASQDVLLTLEDNQRADPRFDHVAEGMAWTLQWRENAVDILSGGGGRVLGGEACLWSELVDAAALPVRLWSRLPAVAERFWSSAEQCSQTSFAVRELQLFHLPEFNIQQMQKQRLADMGLSDAAIDVVQLLEPVKWYARLLGEQALQARLSGTEMPQARPYTTSTELNRVVDVLTPESLAVRAMAQWSFAAWQQAATTWQALDVDSFPQDTQAALHELRELATRIVKADAFSDLQVHLPELQAAYKPHGEYMLAPAYGLLRILDDMAQRRK